MKILVPWVKWGLFGGLQRFVHIKRTLEKWGHRVELGGLRTQGDNPWHLRVLDYPEMVSEIWDAVLIPGAGVSPKALFSFQKFQCPRFGKRVLFVLTDNTVMDRYLRMRHAIQPQVVIWNNTHWSVREMMEYRLKARPYILQGAVDSMTFFPSRSMGEITKQWRGLKPVNIPLIVGAYSAKSSGLMLWLAKQEWPFPVAFRLFGTRYGQAEIGRVDKDKLTRAGVQLWGKQIGNDLAAFYNGCHIVLCDDRRAGWNNVAAEAMACGCVVITRPHGTLAFVKPDINAIVVEDRQPRERFRELLFVLNQHRIDGERISREASLAMTDWSWEAYCKQLEEILINETKTDK